MRCKSRGQTWRRVRRTRAIPSPVMGALRKEKTGFEATPSRSFRTVPGLGDELNGPWRSGTEVMDRRELPPMSGVMPIAGRTAPPPPPRGLALSEPGPRPKPVALEMPTHPARRAQSKLTTYRRLTIALALALAFVAGLLVSVLAQVATWHLPYARAPRDINDRPSTLETKSAQGTAPRMPEPSSRPPEPPRRRAPVLRKAPTRAASTEAPPTQEEPLDSRDLLGEGLGP